jgi:hypothetical protein
MTSTISPSSPWRKGPKDKKRTWDESFQALRAFQKTEGHCEVPRNYPQDTPLVCWVSYQRKIRDTLSDEKRKKLASIGFFDHVPKNKKDDDKWMQKWKLLREYKLKFGEFVPIGSHNY